MANNAQRTSNYTSPYNTPKPLYGFYASSHTTNASLGYSPITYLTPWPFLLGDLCLSFIIALWGYYSKIKTLRKMKKHAHQAEADQAARERAARGETLYSFKTQDYVQVTQVTELTDSQLSEEHTQPKAPRLFSILDWITTIISTIRSVAVFVSTLRAIMYSTSRFRSPASLGLVVLSILPFVTDKTRPLLLRTIMFTDIFLSYVALQINFISRWRSSWEFYGKWFLHNGTCPFTVNSCPENFNLGGCGLQNLTDSIYTDSSVTLFDINGLLSFSNYVPTGDFAVGIALNMGGVLAVASLGLVFVWLYMVGKTIYHVVKWVIRALEGKPRDATFITGVPVHYGSLHHSSGRHSDEEAFRFAKGLLTSRYWSGISVLAIIVVSCTFIPLHYYQQRQPRSIWVIDSYGPISQLVDSDAYTPFNNNTSHGWQNMTTGSWSDCFRVAPPADKMGFFEFWWQDVKNRPLEYLPVL